MKCIQCQTDNNLKDRTANQGRCKNCNHPFVFEPTSMGNVKITDPFFARAIAALSDNQNLSFTFKQFFYFFDRFFKNKKWIPKNILLMGNYVVIILLAYVPIMFLMTIGLGSILILTFGSFFDNSASSDNIFFAIALFLIQSALFSFWIYLSRCPKLSPKERRLMLTLLQVYGCIILLAGIISATHFNSFIIYTCAAAICLAAIWSGLLFKGRQIDLFESPLFLPSEMDFWLTFWQRSNGRIATLLPPLLPEQVSTDSFDNCASELTAYSFDRAVICEKAEIAQMLLANNFHFEHNCAILSVDGYPRNIFGTVREMLQRNPNLQVYALHDLSPYGLRLIPQLRNSHDWFANHPVSIIDVGLTPAQFFSASRNFYVRRNEAYGERARQLEPEIIASLTPEQKAWLEAGNYIELESFTPKMLIQILQRWLGRGQQLTDADSGFIVLGDGDDTYLYATESFG